MSDIPVAVFCDKHNHWYDDDGDCPYCDAEYANELLSFLSSEGNSNKQLWKEQILIEIPEVRYRELLVQNTQLRAHLTELTSITATLSPDSAVATWEALGAVTGKALEGLK